MHTAPSDRFTFIAQWALAVLLPVFVYLGRGLVGAELGWMAVIGITVLGLPTIAILLLPPVVGLFDPPVRTTRSVRRPYAVATWVLWGAFVVGGLAIPDSGDYGHLDSALSRWTGISYETSEAIFYVALAVSLLAWLCTAATATAGALRARPAARSAVL